MKLKHPEKNEQFHVVQFMGGLGNQMFQYAFGRLLASELGIKVYYAKKTFDKIKIDVLGADIDFIEMEDCRVSKSSFRHIVKNGIKQIFSKKFFLRRYEEIEHHRFDEGVFQVQGNHYFFGYWQSWRYLEMLKKHVASIFKFPEIFEQKHRVLLDGFRKDNAVAIHVRRGDYVANPEFNRVHGVCSIEYYREAIRQLREVVSGISIYWFSDDRDWVEEHLISEFGGTFVRGNSDLEDLYLMSQCRHNIIANSSFSWWAAYLNESDGKMVFYPEKWYAVKDRRIEDLCPLDWRKVKWE